MTINYLVSIVWFVLWIAALIDCLKGNNPNKVAWVVVIVLLPFLGSILLFPVRSKFSLSRWLDFKTGSGLPPFVPGGSKIRSLLRPGKRRGYRSRWSGGVGGGLARHVARKRATCIGKRYMFCGANSPAFISSMPRGFPEDLYSECRPEAKLPAQGEPQ
jgi:hypothetical protein